MVKRILALSLLMVGLVACGGQEDPAGELMTELTYTCSGGTTPGLGIDLRCVPNN